MKGKKEDIINGDRYCSMCGEFLGMTCDPFGRSGCSKDCHNLTKTKTT